MHARDVSIPLVPCVRARVRAYTSREHRNALTRQFAQPRARLKGCARGRCGRTSSPRDYFIRAVLRGCVVPAPLKVLDTPSLDITRSCPRTSITIPFARWGIYVPAAPLYALSFRDPRSRGRHTHYSYLNVKRDPKIIRWYKPRTNGRIN